MKKCLVIALIALLAAPTVTRADGYGALSGRILVANGGPAAKAVWLADAGGGSLLRSIPVAADGTFRAETIAAGRVSLAVETGDGLYTVESPVTIAPGTTRSLSIALRGREDSNKPKEPASKKKLGVWNNPLFASLIVIGGAIVVGLAVDQLTNSDNKKTPVSPSVPGK